MKKLLLTGFEAFSTIDENPTSKLVQYFHKKQVGDFEVFSKVLSVSYQKSIEEVKSLIEEVKPDAIINLGVAADRSEITPELIAINYTHAEIKDNDGDLRLFSKIDEKAKESFFSTLPLERIIQNLKNAGINAKLSTTAGSYVCNTVMYTTLQTLAQQKINIPAGFIHIPLNIDQDKLINALTISINSL